MPVRGIERVRTNFRAAVQDAAQRKTEGAVYAILSQGAAIASTMTPIDTSTLINSQYAPQVQVGTTKTTGDVGYTASYAGAVHEAKGVLKGQPRPDNRGDYWDPNAEPEFLTKGFGKVKPSIPAILKAYYGAR